MDIAGNPGADRITLSNHTTQRIACPYTIYGAYGAKPGFLITISTSGGNDTISARDSIYSDINCGGGYDVAYVDLIDTVKNCERAYRG
jgi:hypothetical protein